MAKRRRRRRSEQRSASRRLDAFAEPAHVGRLYVGHAVGTSGRVPKATLRAIMRTVVDAAGGGATIQRAQGRYHDPKPGSPHIKEGSTVIEVVTSGAQACSRAHERLKYLAAAAAGAARQSSVLAVTSCASGQVEAEFVGPDGGRAFPLSPLNGWGVLGE